MMRGIEMAITCNAMALATSCGWALQEEILNAGAYETGVSGGTRKGSQVSPHMPAATRIRARFGTGSAGRPVKSPVRPDRALGYTLHARSRLLALSPTWCLGLDFSPATQSRFVAPQGSPFVLSDACGTSSQLTQSVK